MHRFFSSGLSKVGEKKSPALGWGFKNKKRPQLAHKVAIKAKAKYNAASLGLRTFSCI
jgi:hypothetical protein